MSYSNIIKFFIAFWTLFFGLNNFTFALCQYEVQIYNHFKNTDDELELTIENIYNSQDISTNHLSIPFNGSKTFTWRPTGNAFVAGGHHAVIRIKSYQLRKGKDLIRSGEFQVLGDPKINGNFNQICSGGRLSFTNINAKCTFYNDKDKDQSDAPTGRFLCEITD